MQSQQGGCGGADQGSGGRPQAHLHEVHLRVPLPGDQGSRPQRQSSWLSGTGMFVLMTFTFVSHFLEIKFFSTLKAVGY